MVWTLRKMGFPLEIQEREIQGAFRMKPILKKGYYQDSLQDDDVYSPQIKPTNQRKGSWKGSGSSDERQISHVINDEDWSYNSLLSDESFPLTRDK